MEKSNINFKPIGEKILVVSLKSCGRLSKFSPK
jgi:hypothetical protein